MIYPAVLVVSGFAAVVLLFRSSSRSSSGC